MKSNSVYFNLEKFIIPCIVLLTINPFNGWSQHKSLLLHRNFYKKQDSTWTLMTKEHYSYDIQGRLKSMISFDSLNGQWLNHLKTDYQYSQNDKEASRTEITSEGTGQAWSAPVRSAYVLDQNGRDQVSVSELYDSASGEWKLLNKGHYMYIDDRIYQKSFVKPDTNGWKNEDQTLYNYIDTLDTYLLSNEKFYNWTNDNWAIYQMTVYHYSNARQISHTEIYNTDKNTGRTKSMPDTRHIFIYNQADNLIERIIERFNNGVWEERFRRESIWSQQ
ncbi:MAG: hypothetical protein ABI761_17010 [Saprospiraceae bacterium]